MAVVWAPNIWTGDLEPTLEFGRGFPCVGRISIVVKGAQRISRSHPGALSCVELCLGSGTPQRTKYVTGSEPLWDETFDFALDGKSETLSIRVLEMETVVPPKDKRKGSPLMVLGQCTLPLYMLLPFAKPRTANPPKPGKHMAWFELTKSAKTESAGHVQLTVLYYPPSMCGPQAAIDQSVKEKLRLKQQQEKKLSGSKIFGGSLLDSLRWTDTEGLPQVLVKTVEHIRKTGMDVQGIFRIVAKTEVLMKLKDDFENLKDVDMRDVDPHDAAGLLKMYVRELSEPLIPFSHYGPFLDVAAGRFNIFEEVEQYKILIASIPADRRRVLRYIFEFLYDVTLHSANNRMVPSSLAVVFAPNLLRSENDSPQSALLNSPNAIRVVGTLIESFRRIFETGPVMVHFGPQLLESKEASSGSLGSPLSASHKNWTLPRKASIKSPQEVDLAVLWRTRSDKSSSGRGSLSFMAEDDLTLPVAGHQPSLSGREFSRAVSASSEYLTLTKEELDMPLQVLTSLAREASAPCRTNSQSPRFIPLPVETSASLPPNVSNPSADPFVPSNAPLSSSLPNPSLLLSNATSTNLLASSSATSMSSTSGLSPALYSQLVFSNTRQRSKTTW